MKMNIPISIRFNLKRQRDDKQRDKYAIRKRGIPASGFEITKYRLASRVLEYEARAQYGPNPMPAPSPAPSTVYGVGVCKKASYESGDSMERAHERKR
ncbi:hypothetical protein EVAR_42603_1 [Eumeta japonica]|uniref:Uncharacterized protein n=1 Tax=Eumeta variegata TaxID=151549 RepID=A0A4C1XNM6_EUMVA|nr:hypothetical protein EVAR_42603_1 [Eumeta japonica]